MKNMPFALALILVLVTAACARQDHQRIGDLVVSVPWTRATPPHASVAGGFLTIQNLGSEDDRLLAVESSAAARIEIHEVRHEDGMAKMREVTTGLPIPAGATVVLKPGGYHLMFIQPLEPFVAGKRVAATLVFENAGRLQTEFDVRALGSSQADAEHSHH